MSLNRRSQDGQCPHQGLNYQTPCQKPAQHLPHLSYMFLASYNHRAYERRIKELREFASEDDECSDIREPSGKDFRRFIESIPEADKAGLGLLDNGNLSAIWERRDRELRIELEFLGDGLCEYVIFNRRTGAGEVSRGWGKDTLDGVKKQICAFGIPSLENI